MKATICGLMLLVAAFVAMLITQDLGILPLLLMLVGGWCLGFAFVNLTFRMPRNGLAVHIAGAVVITAEVVTMIEFGGPLLAVLPEPSGAAVVVVQMAAIPAAGWIWLGLLGRVTDALTRRARKNAPTRRTPEWERDESGDGSLVSVRVIELRMRQLTLAIIGIVLVAGAVAAGLLIAFDDVVVHLGAKLSIVLVAIVLGLPAYAALGGVVRRRTEECTIAFGDDEVRIVVGTTASVIRYADLDRLLWRCGSDYARAELCGGGVDLSLFSGLAKPAPGRTAELPPLPRRVFTRLERAGLVVERSRRADVATFRRAVS
jgi:hypothetical protein